MIFIIGAVTCTEIERNSYIEPIIIPEKEIAEEVEGIVGVASYYVTGYCLNKNKMASGLMPYNGAVACPRSIKLKTKIIINGEKYICEDRLSLKYDNRFDIWFENCNEAVKWGKKKY